jgi:hypothetical protein
MVLETWPEAIKISRNKPLMLSALGGKYHLNSLFIKNKVLNLKISLYILIGLIWYLRSVSLLYTMLFIKVLF